MYNKKSEDTIRRIANAMEYGDMTDKELNKLGLDRDELFTRKRNIYNELIGDNGFFTVFSNDAKYAIYNNALNNMFNTREIICLLRKLSNNDKIFNAIATMCNHLDNIKDECRYNNSMNEDDLERMKDSMISSMKSRIKLLTLDDIRSFADMNNDILTKF